MGRSLSDQIGAKIKRAKGGDQKALAQLLSWVERTGPKALAEAELLSPSHSAFRIGITGPPGAGKSTLVGHLIREFRKLQMKVGIIAVDPSSPFTRGAILGDRIRYSDHVLDAQVFIRSLGSRGSLGGLSASAYLMLRVFDACEFDVVLIETVGVGQTELEVVNVADQIAVVLVPESGDSVQAMKAGLLEIADVFVVNKADRPGAESLAKELQFIGETGASNGARAEVLMTVATQGTGVPELAKQLLAKKNAKRDSALRCKQEAMALLREKFETSLRGKVVGVKTQKDLARVLGVSVRSKLHKRKPK